MNKFISHFTPHGEITPPPSKSYCHRYLIASFIRGKKFKINNFNFCDDTIATLNALKELGAEFEADENSVTFIKRGSPKKKPVIQVESSGSTLRMLLPLAAYLCDEVTFVGNEDLFKRPLDVYIELFNKNDVFTVVSNKSIKVRNRLMPGTYEVKGDVSSQFISGLLFLNAETGNKCNINITTETVSTPYIEMTKQVIEETMDLNKYECTIESDISAASNFIVLGAFKGGFRLNNINPDSKQGDIKIIEILRDIGAKITAKQGYLEFLPSELKPLDIDIRNCIDLGPIIFVLASLINGTSKITGYENLRYKESNRYDAIVNQLSHLGIKFRIKDKVLYITGNRDIKGHYVFKSYNDHRIVMALSIFAIVSGITAEIEGYKCVKKSYPSFFDALEELGNEAD